MKIEVVEYTTNWPRKFANERDSLLKAIGDTAVAVHHIGSTAVPNLAAKPIIDILIEVSALSSLDVKSRDLKALGYESLGEFGIARRRYFRKGVVERTHQIHAFEKNDPHIRRHLAFRDYLIAYPHVAREYAHLKMALAEACDNDIDYYCDGKDEFVKEHERRALEWLDTQQVAAVDRPKRRHTSAGNLA